MTNLKFNCYLIGAESLLIQCAEILQQRGHQIEGIVTTAVPLLQWAQAQNIPTFTLNKNLTAELQQRPPFDYLFSITNLAVLPADLLALPRLGSINFHDGPLPKYAGLYATSWALLHQEKQHGITWHTMTAVVDEGQILRQRLVDVSETDTAFSLNMKTYEAGIESFPVLVADIENNSLQPQIQNLAEKTYFGKYQRPSAAATLHWTQPAAEIAALVRALDFGAYENPLILPKLRLGETVYYAAEITILNNGAAAVPGQIITLSADSLTVATATQPVQFTRLRGLDGAEVDVQTLGLSVGSILPVLSAKQQEQLTAVTDQTARQEGFWVKRLAQLAAVEIPYANHAEISSGRYARQQMNPPTAVQSIAAHLQATPADALTTTFIAYLARLSDAVAFDVAVSYPALAQKTAPWPAYFAAELPFAARLDPHAPATDTLAAWQRDLDDLRAKRHTFAWDVFGRYPQLKASQSKAGKALLPVSVAQVDDTAVAQPQPGSELSLFIGAAGEMAWVYDTAVYTATAISAMQSQFHAFLDNLAATPGQSLAQTSLLTPTEYQQLIHDWNATDAPYDQAACIHTLIEAQAAQRPDAIALAHQNQQITYGELDRRSNQLAHYLRTLGVGPDVVVGVLMERSIELMVALLGIHKAGGAYLPLDPDYPQERLAFMAEDAAVTVLLAQERTQADLPTANATVVRLDADWPTIAAYSAAKVHSGVTPANLSYLIYTSGSTGKPKGVMVQHGNAVNFFVGMDQRIPHNPPGIWLAVTSLSFDISVLELFWTLSRGFKVVIFDGYKREAETAVTASTAHKPLDFSLFYFASDESEEGVADKYHLLLEGARYGDQHGFAAIWTPERHFHAFGGLYPNPAVASAAIAAITQRIQIRAGSCVLPLHHPARVVEEWSLVDNISKGRVGIAFAAGWQPNDFTLLPQNYARRKELLFENIEVVRRLWRGETVAFPGPRGEDVHIRTLPRPIQEELPIWITAAGNPETFRMAGAGGFHLLTHLLGQTVEQLGEKLEVYRQAWRDAGHPGEGHVSLMLHTFIGDNLEMVRDTVRQPMKEYLRSAVDLVKEAAWHFPTFKQKAETTGKSPKEIFETEELTAEETDALLEFAFNRYFETSGLFGTTESVMPLVNRLKQINVDEIACQIDFGVPSALVLQNLPLLNQVKNQAAPTADADYSIAALARQHQVTHFQCTPSMARMLLLDELTAVPTFGALQAMMVGGEALPAALAQQLQQIVPGVVVNMYGPTETTVWSSTYQLAGGETAVPIGTPIANTQLYILNSHNQPVPVGVAGSLFIGGAGVVRGYLNRPELTAERFVANPFRPGERMYYTGDLARYRPDGCVEFLGRADFQVKMRGYRIELGEIEALLNRHEAVNEAVVVAREDVPGDVRLVAYITLLPGRSASDDSLKAALKADLPEFMVPAHYVVMDAFPLTPNKKVDRKALPAPDQSRAMPQVAYVPPTSQLEEQIAAIWRQVLNVPQVGLNDNFFDLGGHSLLTVQVHRELKGLVAKPLAITDLFRFPTIRALVEFLDGQSNGQSNGTATAVTAGSDRAAARREALQGRLQRGQRR
ncbi:MAG: LLM class flavin-dependent oxidoreductase [Chloroflexi bacterium]|nr:LLM class flavin-dependent oxidoreductase [Chloroflexota bacterium]